LLSIPAAADRATEVADTSTTFDAEKEALAGARWGCVALLAITLLIIASRRSGKISH
jgi:hypothetical protein